jgi:hypothetical protein
MKAKRLSSDGKEVVKGQPLLADVARAVLGEIEKEGRGDERAHKDKEEV